MKASSARCGLAAQLRRRWLSPLLLILYVAAVHGLPALHLAWHKSDHVHQGGGLRWLSVRLPVHTHGEAFGAGHATPDAHDNASFRSDGSAPPVRIATDDGSTSDGFLLHLVAGPAHGQQSLLASRPMPTFASTALFESALPPPLPPASRDFGAEPRARAPPALI